MLTLEQVWPPSLFLNSASPVQEDVDRHECSKLGRLGSHLAPVYDLNTVSAFVDSFTYLSTVVNTNTHAHDQVLCTNRRHWKCDIIVVCTCLSFLQDTGENEDLLSTSSYEGFMAREHYAMCLSHRPMASLGPLKRGGQLWSSYTSITIFTHLSLKI